MKVETSELLTVKSFANQLGLKVRNKEYSAQNVYKMIDNKKVPLKHIVDIDGILFIHKKALEHDYQAG